ncbi:MAG: 6-phosphogluconolactonase, partial [Candidatus Omnitrophica bacterium]|nr:6-phosphogluconolactonase [Candidatus Omnitrophota bacterium]
MFNAVHCASCGEEFDIELALLNGQDAEFFAGKIREELAKDGGSNVIGPARDLFGAVVNFKLRQTEGIIDIIANLGNKAFEGKFIAGQKNYNEVIINGNQLLAIRQGQLFNSGQIKQPNSRGPPAIKNFIYPFGSIQDFIPSFFPYFSINSHTYSFPLKITDKRAANSPTVAGNGLRRAGILADGGKTVVMGGGSGTKTVCQAILKFNRASSEEKTTIFAIVDSSDSGGSTARIQAALHTKWHISVPAFGDLMSVMSHGLPKWKQEILEYRFKDEKTTVATPGKLKGIVKEKCRNVDEEKELNEFIVLLSKYLYIVDKSLIENGILILPGQDHSVKNLFFLGVMIDKKAIEQDKIDKVLFMQGLKHISSLMGSEVVGIPVSFASHYEAKLAASLRESETVTINDKKIITDRIVDQIAISTALHSQPYTQMFFLNGSGLIEAPKANPEAIKIIDDLVQGDRITIGPGSEITSKLAVIAVKGIPEALVRAKERGVDVVFIFNTAQDSETVAHNVLSLIQLYENTLGYAFETIFSSIVINRLEVVPQQLRDMLEADKKELDNPLGIPEAKSKLMLDLFLPTEEELRELRKKIRVYDGVFGMVSEIGTREAGKLGATRKRYAHDPLKLAFLFKLLDMVSSGTIPVIISDMDETLTPSRAQIAVETARKIIRILAFGGKFVILTGSHREGVQSQVLDVLEPLVAESKELFKDFYLFLNNGTESYRFDMQRQEFQVLYKLDLIMEIGRAKVEKVKEIGLETVKQFGIKAVQGDFIDDRGSQITFFPTGKDVTREEKLIYDAQGGRANREIYAEFINQRFKEEGIDNLSAKVAGKTSIDIGIENAKAHGIEKIEAELKVDKSSFVYLGDSFGLKGNDRDVVEKVDIIVNVGPEVKLDLAGKVFLNSQAKGPEGCQEYLDIASLVLRENKNLKDGGDTLLKETASGRILQIMHEGIEAGPELSVSFEIRDLSGFSPEKELPVQPRFFASEAGNVNIAYVPESRSLQLFLQEKQGNQLRATMEYNIELNKDYGIARIEIKHSRYSGISFSKAAIIFNDSGFAEAFPMTFGVIKEQCVFPEIDEFVRKHEVISTSTMPISEYAERIAGLVRGAINEQEWEELLANVISLKCSKSQEIRRKAIKFLEYLKRKNLISEERFGGLAEEFLMEDIREDLRFVERTLRHNDYFVRNTFKNLFGKIITKEEIKGSRITATYFARGNNKQIYRIQWSLQSGEELVFAISSIRDAQLQQGDFGRKRISSAIDNWECLLESEIPGIVRLGASCWIFDRNPKTVTISRGSGHSKYSMNNDILLASREFKEGKTLKSVLSGDLSAQDKQSAMAKAVAVYFNIWLKTKDEQGQGLFVTTPRAEDIIVFKNAADEWEAVVVDMDTLESGVTFKEIRELFALYQYYPDELIKRIVKDESVSNATDGGKKFVRDIMMNTQIDGNSFDGLWRIWKQWRYDGTDHLSFDEITMLPAPVKAHTNFTFDLLKDYVSGPVSVDIGAGKGKLALKLLEGIPGMRRVIATDLFPTDIGPVSGFEFRLQGNKDRLPVDTGSANTGLLIYVLHHTDFLNQKSLLREINRILLPEGRAIILEDTFSDNLPAENRNSYTRRFNALTTSDKFEVLSFFDWWNNRSIIERREIFPFTYRSMDAWVKVFSDSGFNVLKQRNIGIPEGRLAPRGLFVLEKSVIRSKDGGTKNSDSTKNDLVGAVVNFKLNLIKLIIDISLNIGRKFDVKFLAAQKTNDQVIDENKSNLGAKQEQVFNSGQIRQPGSRGPPFGGKYPFLSLNFILTFITSPSSDYPLTYTGVLTDGGSKVPSQTIEYSYSKYDHGYVTFIKKLHRRSREVGYRVDKETKFSLLIGGNVKTSPSYRLYNRLLQMAGEDVVYLPYEISSEKELEEMLQILRYCCHLIELAISDPYKITVIEYLDILSDAAQKAQAVNNVIKRNDGKLLGSIFDGDAWIYWWKNILNKPLDNKKIVHLGAGGVARAFAVAVAEHAQGIELVFSDPNQDRLNELEVIINSWGKDIKVKTIRVERDSQSETLNQELVDADILINGTGLGKTKGNIYAYPQLDYSLLQGKICIDWNYRPAAKSLFLKYSQDNGAEIYNALGLLITGFYYTFHAVSDKKGVFNYEKLLEFAKDEFGFREAIEVQFEGDIRLEKARAEIAEWLPLLRSKYAVQVLKEIKHRIPKPEVPFIEQLVLVIDDIAQRDEQFARDILKKLKDYFSVTGLKIFSNAIEYHLPYLLLPQQCPSSVGFVGLGRMGKGMVRMLLKNGYTVVVYNRSQDAVRELEKEGAVGADNLKNLVEKLSNSEPKLVWLMIPAGKPVRDSIGELSNLLSCRDVIVDAGNSNPRESRRNALLLRKKGINFMDIGSSGGLEGATNGLSLSVGGSEAVARIIESVLRALSVEGGISFVPYTGMGHLTKMVHNSIEYAAMQAIAESMELLYTALRIDCGLDEASAVTQLVKITESWKDDPIIGSYLLTLLNRGLKDSSQFNRIGDTIGGGESGNWGLREARRLDIPTPLLSLGVTERFRVSHPDTIASTRISYLAQAYKVSRTPNRLFAPGFLNKEIVSNEDKLADEVKVLLAYTISQIIGEGLQVIYTALRNDHGIMHRDALRKIKEIVNGWRHGTIIRSSMLDRISCSLRQNKVIESLEPLDFTFPLDTAKRLSVPLIILSMAAKKEALANSQVKFEEAIQLVEDYENLRANEYESFMSRVVAYLRFLFGGHAYSQRRLDPYFTQTLGGEKIAGTAINSYSFSESANDLAEAGKTIFERSAQEAISRKGIFTVAICGGRSPQMMFERLKDAQVDWSKTHIFWTDERPARPDIGKTNYEVAYETFLGFINIPQANIHRIDLSALNHKKEARRYGRELRDILGSELSFDLMVLGAGNDGHILSIFPGSSLLSKKGSAPVSIVKRSDTGFAYTLTPQMVRNAGKILFFITGEEKHNVLKTFMREDPAVEDFPTAILKDLTNQRVTVLTDLRLDGESKNGSVQREYKDGGKNNEVHIAGRDSILDISDPAVIKLIRIEAANLFCKEISDSKAVEIATERLKKNELPLYYTEFPSREMFYCLARELILEKLKEDINAPLTFAELHNLTSLFYYLEQNIPQELRDNLSKEARSRLRRLFEINNIKDILEIGCAASHFIDFLYPIFRDRINFYGIDLVLRENVEKPRLKIVKGDANNLGEYFGEQKFDLIVSEGVFSLGGEMKGNSMGERQRYALKLHQSAVNHLSDNPVAAVISRSMQTFLLFSKEQIEEQSEIFLWDNSHIRNHYLDSEIEDRIYFELFRDDCEENAVFYFSRREHLKKSNWYQLRFNKGFLKRLWQKTGAMHIIVKKGTNLKQKDGGRDVAGATARMMMTEGIRFEVVDSKYRDGGTIEEYYKQAYLKDDFELKVRGKLQEYIDKDISMEEFVEQVMRIYDRRTLKVPTEMAAIRSEEYRFGNNYVRDFKGDKDDHKSNLRARRKGDYDKLLERSGAHEPKRTAVKNAIIHFLSLAELEDWTSYEVLEIDLAMIRAACSGNDPDKKMKQDTRTKVFKVFDTAVEIVRKKGIESALRLAAFGNSLDFADRDKLKESKKIIANLPKNMAKEVENQGFWSREDAVEFNNAVKNSGPKKIIFAFDNAGEDIFDFILINQLLKLGHSITLACKSFPAANDTTTADAAALIAHNKIAALLGEKASKISVVGTGTRAQGTDLKRVSKEFLDVWKEADLVIFKGQGNYYTLNHSLLSKDCFFLLNVKWSPEIEEKYKKDDFVLEYLPAQKDGGKTKSNKAKILDYLWILGVVALIASGIWVIWASAAYPVIWSDFIHYLLPESTAFIATITLTSIASSDSWKSVIKKGKDVKSLLVKFVVEHKELIQAVSLVGLVLSVVAVLNYLGLFFVFPNQTLALVGLSLVMRFLATFAAHFVCRYSERRADGSNVNKIDFRKELKKALLLGITMSITAAIFNYFTFFSFLEYEFSAERFGSVIYAKILRVMFDLSIATAFSTLPLYVFSSIVFREEKPLTFDTIKDIAKTQFFLLPYNFLYWFPMNLIGWVLTGSVFWMIILNSLFVFGWTCVVFIKVNQVVNNLKNDSSAVPSRLLNAVKQKLGNHKLNAVKDGGEINERRVLNFDRKYAEYLRSVKSVSLSEDVLRQVVSRIIEKRNRNAQAVYLVAIDGNSGALKSTSAVKIAELLRSKGVNVIVIIRDWFIGERTERYQKIDAALSESEFIENDEEIYLRKEKFVAEVLEELERLKSGEYESKELRFTELYNREDEGRLNKVIPEDGEPPMAISRGTVVIVEGNYLLKRAWQKYFDFRIMMLVKPSIGAERRGKRDDFTEKNKVKEMFWRVNTPSYFEYLKRENPLVDLVITTDSATGIIAHDGGGKKRAAVILAVGIGVFAFLFLSGWYAAALAVNSLLIKILSTAAAYFIGDLIAQSLSSGKDKALNKKRLVAQAIWGGITGVILSAFYFWLNLTFTGNFAFIFMVLVDQFVYTTLFVHPVNFAVRAIEEGKIRDWGTIIRKEYKTAVITNWMFWIPVLLVNYSLIPLDFRVLFTNFALLFWTPILSMLGHGEWKKIVDTFWSRGGNAEQKKEIDKSADLEYSVRSEANTKGNDGKDGGEEKNENIDPFLIRSLAWEDKDQELYCDAYHALVKKGKSAVNTLIDALLTNENTKVRRTSAEILGKIKDSRAVEPLFLALKDKEGAVSFEAAIALGKLKDPRAVEPLIEALKSEKKYHQRKAIEVLRILKDPRAIESLILVLKDKKDVDTSWGPLRNFAAEAIAEIEFKATKEIIRDLIYSLNFESSSKATTKILIKIGQSAVPELLKALRCDDKRIRKAAVEALGKISPLDENSILELIALVEDKDYSIRNATEKALLNHGVLTPELRVKKCVADLNIDDYFDASEAAESLGEIYHPAVAKAIPALRKALTNKNESVRKTAAKTLARIELYLEIGPMCQATMDNFFNVLSQKGMSLKFAQEHLIFNLMSLFKEKNEGFVLALNSGTELIRSDVQPCNTMNWGIPIAWKSAKGDIERYKVNLEILEEVALAWYSWIRAKDEELRWKEESAPVAAYVNLLETLAGYLVENKFSLSDAKEFIEIFMKKMVVTKIEGHPLIWPEGIESDRVILENPEADGARYYYDRWPVSYDVYERAKEKYEREGYKLKSERGALFSIPYCVDYPEHGFNKSVSRNCTIAEFARDCSYVDVKETLRIIKEAWFERVNSGSTDGGVRLSQNSAAEILLSEQAELKDFLRKINDDLARIADNLQVSQFFIELPESISYAMLPDKKATIDLSKNELIFDLGRITSVDDLRAAFWEVCGEAYFRQLKDWHERLSVLGQGQLCMASSYIDYLLRNLIDRDNLEGVIVDAGTGPGTVAIGLKKAGAKNVIGIDISSYVLSCAKISMLEEGVDLELVKGDALRLPLRDNSVNAFYFANVLKYLPSIIREEALAEVHRVLKASGRLYVYGSQEIMMENTHLGVKEEITTEWTRKEWEKYLVESGFASIDIYDCNWGEELSWWRKVSAIKSGKDGGRVNFENSFILYGIKLPSFFFLHTGKAVSFKDGGVTFRDFRSVTDRYYFYGNGALAATWIDELARMKGEDTEKVLEELIRSSGLQGKLKRYPILPEELFIYMLPFVAQSRKTGKAPFFLERTSKIFEPAWDATVEMLNSEGIEGLSSLKYSYRITKKYFNKEAKARELGTKDGRIVAIAPQINSFLTEEELLAPVSREKWNDLEAIYSSAITREDRAKIDNYISSWGVEKGFAGIAGKEMTVGRLITLIADAGIDTQLYYKKMRNRTIENLLDELVENGSLELSVLSLKLSEVLNADELKFLFAKIGHLVDANGVFSIEVFANLQEALWSITAKDARRMKGTLKHSARPLLNELLKDTVFGRFMNTIFSRVLFLDEASYTGDTVLLAEIIGKSFNPYFDSEFGVISVDDKEIFSSPGNGRKLVEVFSTQGEVKLYENDPSKSDVLYELQAGDIERFKRFTYDDMEAILRQKLCENAVSADNLDALLEQYGQKINDFIEANNDIFHGLSHLAYYERHDGFSIYSEIVKLFLREDSLVSKALVYEYLEPYSYGEIIDRLIKNEVSLALARLAQKEKRQIQELEELDARVRFYEELKVILYWKTQREAYVERIRQGARMLGQPEIMTSVKQYLNNPSSEGFDALRASITARIAVGRKPAEDIERILNAGRVKDTSSGENQAIIPEKIITAEQREKRILVIGASGFLGKQLY